MMTTHLRGFLVQTVTTLSIWSLLLLLAPLQRSNVSHLDVLLHTLLPILFIGKLLAGNMPGNVVFHMSRRALVAVILFDSFALASLYALMAIHADVIVSEALLIGWFLPISSIVGQALLSWGVLQDAHVDQRRQSVHVEPFIFGEVAAKGMVEAKWSWADTGYTCIVCLEDLQQGASVARIPCGHIFHEARIRQWLYLGKAYFSCPYRCQQQGASETSFLPHQTAVSRQSAAAALANEVAEEGLEDVLVAP